MPDIKGGPFWLLQDNTPEIIVLLHKQVSEAVRKAALDIQAHAMTNAPVATGFLKSSVYTVSKGKSTYGKIQAHLDLLLPEIPQPADDQTAYTAVGASYGPYVEYGTSKQAAHPYMQPAFDAVVPTFLEAMKRIEEKFPGLNAGTAAAGGTGITKE